MAEIFWMSQFKRQGVETGARKLDDTSYFMTNAEGLWLEYSQNGW